VALDFKVLRSILPQQKLYCFLMNIIQFIDLQAFLIL